MIRTYAAALLLLIPGAALAQDQVRHPGDSMNGQSINGPSMEGPLLEKSTLAGLAGGTTADGQAIQSVETWNGTLLARGWGGAPIAIGREMTGAVLQGIAADGSNLVLRIDRVDPSTNAEDQDVFFHQVSRQVCGWTTDPAGWPVFGCWWTPLCGADAAGAPVASVPLQGTWTYAVGLSNSPTYRYQPGGITFSCQGFVLEKCAVSLGYKPWLPDRRDLHQACVQMLRADYCGDGTHTFDGTLVHASDDVVINPWPSAEPGDPTWKLEALWSPTGAVCLFSERQVEMQHLFKSACPDLAYNTPPCPAAGMLVGGAVLRNFCAEEAGNPGQCAAMQ